MQKTPDTANKIEKLHNIGNISNTVCRKKKIISRIDLCTFRSSTVLDVRTYRARHDEKY